MAETLAPHQLHIAVDLLILTAHDGKLELLLSQRTEPPYRGCWALPGRMVAMQESAEDSAAKLLTEMLPIPNVYTEQLYTFSSVGRDPRGRVISIAYLVIVPWKRLESLLAHPQQLRCFPITDEPGFIEGGLAFDHAQIIRTGAARLRGKLNYTEVGFHFLDHPEAFSLGDLQLIYESVLGEKLDTSNFRRYILNRYEASGRIRQTESAKKQGRGRPAALYQYIP